MKVYSFEHFYQQTFWCAVPLHIAFHNMVNEKPEIRRQMLRYEPIDLDAIFCHLKEIGLRYESNVSIINYLDSVVIPEKSDISFVFVPIGFDIVFGQTVYHFSDCSGQWKPY